MEELRARIERLRKGRASRALMTLVNPSHAATMTPPHRRGRHRLAAWPAWASRWLGYRATPPPKLSKPLIWFWTFIGAFSGLSVLQALFNYSHYFIGRGVPVIIASYVSTSVTKACRGKLTEVCNSGSYCNAHLRRH